MPTDDEFSAILALATKARIKYDDETTKEQTGLVIAWANKVERQKDKARERARKWNKEHPERHYVSSDDYKKIVDAFRNVKGGNERVVLLNGKTFRVNLNYDPPKIKRIK